jgi:hypothetical protein
MLVLDLVADRRQNTQNFISRHHRFILYNNNINNIDILLYFGKNKINYTFTVGKN